MHGQPLFGGGSFNGFGLFGGTPFASAISRGMIPGGGSMMPNGMGGSVYTPPGWSAPSYNPTSGGATTSYNFNPSTGTGQYVASNGQVYSYSTAHP